MKLPSLFDIVVVAEWVGVIVEINELDGEAVLMFFEDEEEAREWIEEELTGKVAH